MSIFLTIIGSIFGFILLFFVLLNFGSRRMRKVGSDFMSAVKDNRFSDAYILMSQVFKEQVAEEHFEAFLNSREIFNIKEFRRHHGDYSIGAVNGTISPYLIRDDGIYFKVNLQMLKENGEWRVFAIDAELRLTPAPMPVREEQEDLNFIEEISQENENSNSNTLH